MDPTTQALMAAGLGLLGTRGSAGFGRAGLMGLNQLEAAKKMQLLEEESRQRELERQSIAEMRAAQVQQMQAALAEAQRKQQQAEKVQSLVSNAFAPTSPQQALAAGGGPTNEAAALIGQRRPVDYQALIAQGAPPQLVEQLANAANIGRPKVARTIEIDDGRGGKATMQVDEFGRPVGESMPGYVPPVQVNQGDRVTFAKPSAGLSLPVGMSPAERDASSRGWASVGVSRDRLAWDREQKENPPPKPLPPTALKLQADALEKIGVASAINTDITGLAKMIDSGKLTFGPVANIEAKARNMAGASNEQSRNFAEFMANMERLRNESLRLNTGVQTEGDAQRAWNELFASINDKKLVRQNLDRIAALNKRAADLKKLELDQVRANYGVEPMDYSRFDTLPSSVNRGGGAGGAGAQWGGAGGSWDTGTPNVIDWRDLPGSR